MRGYQLIEREAGRWNKALTASQLRSLLLMGALGVVVGLLMANVRLHLGLSGHKILFWMIPIITARLLTRCPLGCIVGTLGAASASLALGGHFAGGFIQLPAVAVAGIVLDVVIGSAERRRLSARWLVPLLGLTGAFASLICLSKRLCAPPGPAKSLLLGEGGLWTDIVSYALFGLVAGIVGAAIACGIRRRHDRAAG